MDEVDDNASTDVVLLDSPSNACDADVGREEEI
jgi:hypothetical protein